MVDALASDSAVERFQTQLADLKAGFAHTLKRIRADNKKRSKILSGEFDTTAIAAVEDEVRRRVSVAAESLREAMDAGWVPSEDALSQTFTRCFNPTDYRLFTFDDLETALHDVVRECGQALTPAVETRLKLLIGNAEVQAVQRSLSALKMDLRIRLARLESEEGRKHSLASGPPSAGLDGTQLTLLRYLEEAPPDIVPPVVTIAQDTGLDVQTVRDELTILVDRGLLRSIRPVGIPVEAGRFLLTDRGRAVLAEYRKQQRSANQDSNGPTAIPTLAAQPSTQPLDERSTVKRLGIARWRESIQQWGRAHRGAVSFLAWVIPIAAAFAALLFPGLIRLGLAICLLVALPVILYLFWNSIAWSRLWKFAITAIVMSAAVYIIAILFAGGSSAR